MDQEMLDELRANSRFLIAELERRGVEVSLVDYQCETYLASFEGRREILVDLDFSETSYPSSIAANNKYVAKKLLASAGFSVPEGERFFPSQLSEAILYAKRIGYPVVVKPCV